MINFTYYTPTRVFFGKDTHKNVAQIIKSYGYNNILFHYGSGSIKKTGLYDEIVNQLRENDITFTELGGVQPNPKLSLVRRGAELCKKNDIEFILAVGGGSVIDSAKAIAVAAKSDLDVWEFFKKRAEPSNALPVGVVLTLAASGSEMSSSAVITNEDGELKRGYNTDFNRPLFSVLNPELTFTVDKFQTGCGVVDIMMHTFERYFTKSKNVELTDNIGEAILKSVISAGKIAINNPCDYEARATLMWAGSLSHNDLTGAGRETFLTVHQIEHELSGIYDRVAHGAGLSILFPAFGKFIYKYDVNRFVRYAHEVWNIDINYENLEETALQGVIATENFFKSLGMPTRLSEIDVDDSRFEEIAEKCTFHGTRTLNTYIPLGKEEILDILNLSK